MSWTTFWRGRVAEEDCDFLGHMTVARYIDCCTSAVFALQETIGLGRGEVLAHRRMSFAVVHMKADFRSEILLGEPLRHEIGVVAIGARSIRKRHRLHAGDPERLAFEAEFKAVLLDLDTRRATDVPEDIRRGLARHLISEEETA